jgi:hypothetical protein
VTSSLQRRDKDINERLGNMLAEHVRPVVPGRGHGAEPKGIIRIKTKTNFTIARKPIPVSDQGPF